MKHGRRTVAVLAAAACLLVGGAIGSGLINAGAATSNSQSKGSPGSAGSNEDATHEQSESAAREAAEDNGTATFGPCGAGHGGGSNEDPAHEKAESAAREAAEDNGTATCGRHHDGDHGPGGGSNEDPAHEKAESAEREAQEGTGTSQPGAPSSGAATTTPAT
jgi:hypothetical protein